MNVTEHIVDVKPDGTYNLFGCEVAKTLTERRDARRASLQERCEKAAEIVAQAPNEQWICWCDLNAESELLAKIIPGSEEVRGSDKPDEKESALLRFASGDLRVLVTKPSIAGFGMNWQQCHNMIFVGLSDSYEQMYQAIRRCYRFGQSLPVNVHIVTSAADGAQTYWRGAEAQLFPTRCGKLRTGREGGREWSSGGEWLFPVRHDGGNKMIYAQESLVDEIIVDNFAGGGGVKGGRD